jgi:hypothetical protein
MFESEKLDMIQKAYPDDIIWDMPVTYAEPPKRVGDPYEKGWYVDEWGCVFTSISPGIVGEVKESLVQDDNWADAGKVRNPQW